MALLIRGNQAIMVGVLFFAVAWMYGLMYYWDNSTQATGLDDKDPGFSKDSGGSGFLDFVFNTALEIFSWASPFALVKGLIILTTDSNLYLFLNLFILRPVGWVASYMFIEWAVFTARGKSE